MIDFARSEIYSKLLNMRFKAVRGRRNNLLGLRIRPADFAEMADSPISPVALMAQDDDGEEEQEQASGSGGPGTIMTYQKKQVPKRRKFTQEVRSVPTMEIDLGSRRMERESIQEPGRGFWRSLMEKKWIRLVETTSRMKSAPKR